MVNQLYIFWYPQWTTTVISWPLLARPFPKWVKGASTNKVEKYELANWQWAFLWWLNMIEADYVELKNRVRLRVSQSYGVGSRTGRWGLWGWEVKLGWSTVEVQFLNNRKENWEKELMPQEYPGPCTGDPWVSPEYPWLPKDPGEGFLSGICSGPQRGWGWVLFWVATSISATRCLNPQHLGHVTQPNSGYSTLHYAWHSALNWSFFLHCVCDCVDIGNSFRMVFDIFSMSQTFYVIR